MFGAECKGCVLALTCTNETWRAKHTIDVCPTCYVLSLCDGATGVLVTRFVCAERENFLRSVPTLTEETFVPDVVNKGMRLLVRRCDACASPRTVLSSARIAPDLRRLLVQSGALCS